MRIVDQGTRIIMNIFRVNLFSFFPSFFEILLLCTLMFRTFSSSHELFTLTPLIAFTVCKISINTTMGRIRTKVNGVENEASSKLTD